MSKAVPITQEEMQEIPQLMVAAGLWKLGKLKKPVDTDGFNDEMKVMETVGDMMMSNEGAGGRCRSSDCNGTRPPCVKANSSRVRYKGPMQWEQFATLHALLEGANIMADFAEREEIPPKDEQKRFAGARKNAQGLVIAECKKAGRKR